MLKFLDIIDTTNEWVGKLFRWAIVLLAFVMCYEVVMRYVFNSPTIWAFEISTALYATTFMMGAAYALLYKAHVSIDIIYEMLGIKGRAVLDIISSVIFFFPFLIVVFIEGLKFAQASWMIHEKTWSNFAMPVYPVKTMIPVMSFLLLIQGLATFIRSIMVISTGKNYESRFKKDEIPTCVIIPVNEENKI
ncbi:MAG: TRAP transporter small permease subunit [Spirochaetia bacterium]|jgi:TRAP-type mannitol/chloroaromatic compound transport system permease small subunit|nr:TRAP transporter small permease subunit [Spirochaetia bacterium]